MNWVGSINLQEPYSLLLALALLLGIQLLLAHAWLKESNVRTLQCAVGYLKLKPAITRAGEGQIGEHIEQSWG